MSNICFTSVLDRCYRSSLEELLFFNPNQHKLSRESLAVIEWYGTPRILVKCNKLRIVCDGFVPQTLYALDVSNKLQSLVGVVVYTREQESLIILHIAIRKDHTQKDNPDAKPLLMDIINKVRDIGRHIIGIKLIMIFPGTSKECCLPIR